MRKLNQFGTQSVGEVYSRNVAAPCGVTRNISAFRRGVFLSLLLLLLTTTGKIVSAQSSVVTTVEKTKWIEHVWTKHYDPQALLIRNISSQEKLILSFDGHPDYPYFVKFKEDLSSSQYSTGVDRMNLPASMPPYYTISDFEVYYENMVWFCGQAKTNNGTEGIIGYFYLQNWPNCEVNYTLYSDFYNFEKIEFFKDGYDEYGQPCPMVFVIAQDQNFEESLAFCNANTFYKMQKIQLPHLGVPVDYRDLTVTQNNIIATFMNTSTNEPFVLQVPKSNVFSGICPLYAFCSPMNLGGNRLDILVEACNDDDYVTVSYDNCFVYTDYFTGMNHVASTFMKGYSGVKEIEWCDYAKELDVVTSSCFSAVNPGRYIFHYPLPNISTPYNTGYYGGTVYAHRFDNYDVRSLTRDGSGSYDFWAVGLSPDDIDCPNCPRIFKFPFYSSQPENSIGDCAKLWRERNDFTKWHPCDKQIDYNASRIYYGKCNGNDFCYDKGIGENLQSEYLCKTVDTICVNCATLSDSEQSIVRNDVPNGDPVTMNVSPNPATSMVEVTFDVEVASLEVIDAMGNRVYSNMSGSRSYNFNVAAWPKGMYTVMAHDSQGIVSKKLIVE